MEWKLVALCNVLEFFMDGTWKCFNEKIKISMMSKGVEGGGTGRFHLMEYFHLMLQ